MTAPVSKDQPVISHPDAGWDSLKRRLISDLSEQHRILPIQARVVFCGLTRLPALNTAAYERHGGLEGLEAAHVEDAMGAAARAAGLTADQVLALLLELVDGSDPDVPKARSVSATDLAEKSGIDGQRSGRAFSVLDHKGIVRHRAGVGAGESLVWSLYHDYLARAVLAAHRRDNHWQRLLKERLQAMRDADSWATRWQTLLSPREQLRVFGATLAGKVRWAGYRRFLALSGLRWLPFLMPIILGGVWAGQLIKRQAQQEVQQILTAIRANPDGQVGGEKYRRLWALASADPRLKRIFLEQSITDTQSHETLVNHLEPVAQSLFGLDPDRDLRNRAIDLVSAHKPTTLYQVGLAAFVYHAAPDVFAAQAPRIAELISTLMQKTTDPDQLAGLGEALGRLDERLPAEQARAGALRLVEVMGTTIDPNQLYRLGTVLGRLGERLPAKQARAVALPLVEVMGTTTDPDQLYRLGEALGGLGERLPAEQARAGALRLMEVMGTTTYWGQLGALSEALGELGEWLPAEQARAGALRLMEVMGTTTYWGQLGALSEALGELGERLPAEQAGGIALRLMEVMGTTTDPDQLAGLGAALGRLGERLPAEQARASALCLVEVMGTTTGSDRLARLSAALGGLGERLPAEQARAGALRLVEVMGTTTDPDQLRALSAALGRLGERLPAEQAGAGALRLVEVMGITTDFNQLASLNQVARLNQLARLGEALGRLGERLPAEQARAVALRLVEVMGTTTGPDWLARLSAPLGRLDERLPAEQARAGALRLVEAMGTPTHPHPLGVLSAALGRLGERLPAEQARAGALRLVEVMGTTTDPDQLAGLGEALGRLCERLPAEQAGAGALRLMEVMGTTTDWNQLDSLSAALGGLGERLPAEQARAVALRLVEIMGTTTGSDQLARLGAALGRLGERLPAEQAGAGALRLVEVMGSPIGPNDFDSLARRLGDIPVTKDTDGIDTAPDLLQAPMAFGETRKHLLHYYSRLAGVFETDEEFRTTDDLVAWMRNNKLPIDLTRLPQNPFR